MNNRHDNLTERYKNIPGKIIAGDNGFLLSSDLRNELGADDLVILKAQKQNTEFSPESRLRWLKVSTSDPDRSGDKMVIEGAVTDNFLRNPQFLWMHGQTGEPVHTLGKILKLVKTRNALYALAKYSEPDICEFAEKIYQLDLGGYLPANSIGFRPIEWEPNEHGGMRFLKWELIEISKVELPCNPFAIDDGEPSSSKRLTVKEAAELL